MGKSWKEKPGKYKFNKDFQKKQKQKNGNKQVQIEPYENMPDKELNAWEKTF